MKKYIFGGIVLILIVVSLFIFKNNEASIVTLDINPSIQIKLTKGEKVKEIVALNEDAKKIVDDNLKGEPLESAFRVIVEKLLNNNFIRLDTEAFIILYSEGSIDKSVVKDKLEASFQNVGAPSHVIIIDNVTDADVKLSKEKGISISKAAYLNSVTNGKDINVDYLLDKSVDEIEEIKSNGYYCDLGYTLDHDRCFKEIRREVATTGKICLEGYTDISGYCYKEGHFTESDKDTCYDGFTLKDGICTRTDSFEAERVCESGVYDSKTDMCRIQVAVGDAYEFCRDSGRTLYEHKCLATKPTINGGCLGKDMLYKGKCVNTRNDYYAAEWKCANGKVISNADGSLLYEDHKCYEEKKVQVNSYKCPDEYHVEGSKCVKVENKRVEKERTCETGYTLIKDGRCIDYKSKTSLVDGLKCDSPNSKVVDNTCIIYDIVDAKVY